MRIAIIDLGTNTFNLFIAETHPGGTYKKLFKSKIPVKLGEGGIGNNHIEKKPFKRGIKALARHKATIEEYKTEKIIAFATSAIRSSGNGKDFIRQAKAETGIDITVISGEREAELIYYGVRSAVKMTGSISLIMDIGGGSTEFVLATKDRILWKQSFLLGAARLLEKFNPDDPIQDKEIAAIEQYLGTELDDLFAAVTLHPPSELLGSSGSFDSLAEMISYRYHTIEDLKGKTEYAFNLDDCYEIYKVIIKSSTAQRLQMEGLVKMRVDMIVVSAIMVNFIIQKLGIKAMRLSRYSLKEGVLWEEMNKSASK